MAKPTAEIIDYARQLKELGVEKPPEVGDWASTSQPDSRVIVDIWLTKNKPCLEFHGYVKMYDDYVVIPDLQWCLGWLKERRDDVILRPQNWGDNSSPWECKVMGLEVTYHTSSHTAVLKAMLEVAKEGK